MSKIVRNGNQVDINVGNGQSLKIAWLGGTYSVLGLAGFPGQSQVLASAANSDQTFGPFTGARVIKVAASAIGAFAWDTGNTLAFNNPGEQFVRGDGVSVVLSGVGPAASFGPFGTASAGRPLPDFVRSFDDVVGASNGYRALRDVYFGTVRKRVGGQQLSTIAELVQDWDYWAYNLVNPLNTINQELQRYVDFNTTNHAFAADALELTASLPNGLPVGVTSTTLSAAATATRTVTVADASAIAVGQVLSLGAAQYGVLHMTRTHRVRGTAPVPGNTVTLTVTLDVDLGIAPFVYVYTIQAGDTVTMIAQALVNLVNAQTELAALGVFAYKCPVNSSAYYIVNPKWNGGASAPALGNLANGSLTWVTTTTSAQAGISAAQPQQILLTYVVSKSGNTLTLNHPITAASGATINIMPSRCMPRAGAYNAAVNPVAVGDVTGLSIGQMVSLSFSDTNLRRITAIDNVGNTITTNTGGGLDDGVFIISLAGHMAVPNANSSTSTMTFVQANFPTAVRPGMQASVYTQQPNGNVKVNSVTSAAGVTTVVLSGPLTVTTANNVMFHEPIQSGQIWSRWGVCPGVDGYTAVALEFEVEAPNAAVGCAWPACWLYKDFTNPTGLPSPPGANAEIDIVDLFNYTGLSSSNSYRPEPGAAPLLYASPLSALRPAAGNNMGIGVRKFQLIFTVDTIYFYLDNILRYAKANTYDLNARPQIGINLAFGSSSVNFNSNGFFPIDWLQLPSKFRVRRFRALAA